MTETDHHHATPVVLRSRSAVRDWVLIALVVVGSGALGSVMKRTGFGPALVAVDPIGAPTAIPADTQSVPEIPVPIIAASLEPVAPDPVEAVPAAAQNPSPIAGVIGTRELAPGAVRYFNGRPVRPARTITMKVTGYSPDARSCGKWADGVTASLKSVWTNGMRLAAADTRILPFGTMISVPGYADGEVIPVLDRGGAIKGNRLDLLYPTHEIARQWGVKRVAVTVWEYAD